MGKDTDEAAETGRLLNIAELAGLLRVHAQSVRKMTRDGRLPPPIRLGTKCLRWRSVDIARWLDSLPTTQEAHRAV